MGVAEGIKKIAEDIIASHEQREKAIDELVADTRRTLEGFSLDRKKMSKEQAQSLADFAKDLTKNVGNMIKDIQKAHKEMADNLNESLKKGEADRLKDFKGMMGGIQKSIKDIESYVANKLKEFNEAHAEMSEELKKELAKYVADVVSETKKLLGGYAHERERMAATWQSMAATMVKKRTGKPIVSAGTEVKTVEEAAAKKTKAKRKGKKKK